MRRSERPQPSAEAFRSIPHAGWSSVHVADVDAARPKIGEDGLVAASAGIESRSEEAAVAVASTPMTAVAVAAAVHAVSAAVATTAMPGRSGCDGSSGECECGEGGEGNLAKHVVFSVQGVIARYGCQTPATPNAFE